MCLYYTKKECNFWASAAQRIEASAPPPMVTRSLQTTAENATEEMILCRQDWEESKRELQELKDQNASRDEIEEARQQAWSDGARARWYQERFEALYSRPNK